MEEKILDIQNLYNNGINKGLFFKLLLNIINGGFGDASPAYANRLKIDGWKELYSYPHIKVDVSEEQILLFLNYMNKYVSEHVNKNNDYYIVSRSFLNNELRTEENFKFESIVFTVLEVTQ